MPVPLIQSPTDIPSLPLGSGEEVTGDAEILSPEASVNRRMSSRVIRYKQPEEVTVQRTNNPLAKPTHAGQLPPEPITRSLFDPGRTRMPAQAFTISMRSPEANGWQQDSFGSNKVEQTIGADMPKGGFMDWAGLRRNRAREYPETYGDIVQLNDDTLN